MSSRKYEAPFSYHELIIRRFTCLLLLNPIDSMTVYSSQLENLPAAIFCGGTTLSELYGVFRSSFLSKEIADQLSLTRQKAFCLVLIVIDCWSQPPNTKADGLFNTAPRSHQTKLVLDSFRYWYFDFFKLSWGTKEGFLAHPLMAGNNLEKNHTQLSSGHYIWTSCSGRGLWTSCSMHYTSRFLS